MKRLLFLFSYALLAGTVWGQTVYVSSAGSHTPPFDTWGKAATNIQQAVDAAGSGDTVLLADGTFSIGAEISLTKAITVTSLNGPDATRITKTATYMRLFNINHASALLCNITVTNGATGQTTQGAGIYVSAGTVSNCVIAECKPNRGSTVYLTGANSRLTHSVIRDNYDLGNSAGCGGVKLAGGTLMQYCTLTRNRCGTEVNGISSVYMIGNSTVQNCVISNNAANSGSIASIALALQAGDTVRNTLIVNNANRGISMAGGTVDCCTVSRNLCYGTGANGIALAGGQVRNSIFYYNGNSKYAASARDCVITGGAISNSCSPLLAGSNNTAAPPLFADPAAADFTLLPGSPCLETATNVPLVALDLLNTARPIDGDSDGTAKPDMGCFEAPAGNTGSLRCGFTASAHEAVGSLAVTFTPFVAGTDTAIVFAGWTFGDGATLNRADLAPVAHTYDPGAYTVSLLVSNSLGQSATAVFTQDIRVAPVASFVAKNGSHTFPYDTWPKAATNVQPALEALLSENGETRTTTVSNGVYALPVELTLAGPLRLVSLNGPSDTVLNRSGASMRLATLSHADALLAGFTVTNGNLGQEGAGVYVSAGTISNCVVASCTGNRSSAVYLAGTNSLMTHSLLRNNSDGGNSGGCGGVKLVTGGRLLYSSILRSSPGSEASGISALVMSGKSLASHCIISNCTMAANKNSIVASVQSDSILRNCLITQNAGRGVHITGGFLENCTISRNSIYDDTANGLYMATATSRNCIVWNNGTDNSKNLTRVSGAFEYGDVNPADPGAGNKSADPLFLTPASGDFRLDPASPLINAGTNLAWTTNSIDLDGSNRLTGAAVDMGCFEAADTASGLACNFDAPVTDGLTNLTAIFTAEATGGNTTIVNYAWSFGDGGSVSGADKRVVTNTYAAPGYYTVSLTIQNDGAQSASRSKTNFIYVAPLVSYVSTNGTHEAPFQTWVTAATNIQSAINGGRVSSDSATLILVSNGVYAIGSQLGLLKGVTVRSVNGAGETALTRTGSATRLVWVNHADATLDGFTVTNGFYTGNSSGGMLLNAGAVRNCVFTGNIGNRMSGALEMTGGTVSNCLFIRNMDNGQTLGCGAVAMSGGLLAGCLLLENRGGASPSEVGGLRVTGGEARNCVIISNVAALADGTIGGAAVSGNGLLRNCLVAANQGKGVSVAGGSVVNCTIVRNSSNGVEMTSGAVTNTIITDNLGGDLAGAGTDYATSCSPALSGNGNISLPPLFVAAGSGYGTNAVLGDYRPSGKSPCLEAGFTFAWAQDSLDLAGGPRLLNRALDIGAYETLKPPTGTILMIR